MASVGVKTSRNCSAGQVTWGLLPRRGMQIDAKAEEKRPPSSGNASPQAVAAGSGTHSPRRFPVLIVDGHRPGALQPQSMPSNSRPAASQARGGYAAAIHFECHHLPFAPQVGIAISTGDIACAVRRIRSIGQMRIQVLGISPPSTQRLKRVFASRSGDEVRGAAHPRQTQTDFPRVPVELINTEGRRR